jgi:hypothetical protein
MQSNLVSRPDESAGFGTFCGRLSVNRGIFSTTLECPRAWTFSTNTNEESPHFTRRCPHFSELERGWIRGFGDICNFKVIPLLCN